MRRFYLLVFYKLYFFAKKISNDDLHPYTAMYMLAILLSLNVMSLYGYYSCLIMHASVLFPPKYLILIVLFLIVLGIYFLYVRAGKYEILFEQLEKSDLDQKKATVMVVTYVILTLLVTTGLIWVKCS